MVRALVTGGTGFVGSAIARELAAAGHTVRVLHRPSSRLTALEGVPYESALGDVTDADALHAASEGCDWVFHVAAVADYWRADRDHMMDVNVGGTLKVLAAAKAAGVKRVVFTSSAAALGMAHDESPADESMRFNLSPSRFPYGYSKALAEIHVQEAVAAGQDVVTMNPVVIMGPGDLNRISGEFVIRIHELGALMPVPPGGVAVTDVRDVARWHIAAAEHGRTGERYILGTENLRYPYWFALIAKTIGAPAPGLPVPAGLLGPLADSIDLIRGLGVKVPVDGNQLRLGARALYFRFEKAWGELGEPTVSMRDSVRDTFTWYQEHGFL